MRTVRWARPNGVSEVMMQTTYPHASDCAQWVQEPCDCVTGREYRYADPPLCFVCGVLCGPGSQERYDVDSDGGYAETLYICKDCLKR